MSLIKDNIIGLIELVLNTDSYDIKGRCNIKIDKKLQQEVFTAFEPNQEEEIDIDENDFFDSDDDDDDDDTTIEELR